jgi:hypothetical protein
VRDHPWPTCQSWAINFLQSYCILKGKLVLWFSSLLLVHIELSSSLHPHPQTPSDAHMHCQRWAMHVQDWAEPAIDLPCLPKHKHHPDDLNNSIVACNGVLHVFYQVGSYEYDSPAHCWTRISVASYSKLRFMPLPPHRSLVLVLAGSWMTCIHTKTSTVLVMAVRGYLFVGSNRGCNATMCITKTWQSTRSRRCNRHRKVDVRPDIVIKSATPSWLPHVHGTNTTCTSNSRTTRGGNGSWFKCFFTKC